MRWPQVPPARPGCIALPYLVALDDFLRLNGFFGLGINLQVLDAVASILGELMEADFFSLAARRIERDWTRYEGQLQIALPVWTRGHGRTPTENN
jgi:hypothetical protein